MPEEIKYDANATPPQFTNNADMVIEPGTQVRVKIIGTRTEVGEMWAIGSIHGDFLGYAQTSETVTVAVINPLWQVFASLKVGRWITPLDASTIRSLGGPFYTGVVCQWTAQITRLRKESPGEERTQGASKCVH
jgi:hypothetical protein